jgi:hypothetical protein
MGLAIALATGDRERSRCAPGVRRGLVRAAMSTGELEVMGGVIAGGCFIPLGEKII